MGGRRERGKEVIERERERGRRKRKGGERNS